jgi:hypothetical protein
MPWLSAIARHEARDSVILPIGSLQEPFSVHYVWHSASGRIIKPVLSPFRTGSTGFSPTAAKI